MIIRAIGSALIRIAQSAVMGVCDLLRFAIILIVAVLAITWFIVSGWWRVVVLGRPQ